ncbi:hypothetical protein IFM89_027139 [Coptis chinensis]|uniref:F-box associated beta-propeller type 1 domain-containing protein n=1 Tax=Coptis chinensis TaxID=261450 RepID=A0A835MDM8_9MAGN|nr:hypothetical protein IFM89_027139 [Coptis chinensis]
MEAEIYSLAKNSWRVIQPMAYTFDAENAENRKGIFFNGVLHWVGTPCPTEESGCDLATTKYVIAFDTQSEEFRTVVQLPPDVPKGFCCIQLAVLDRRLCLVCNFDFEDVLKFEVWVMKDYGLKESWVKLYTITGFDHPYITNTGKFITNESYLYDPKVLKELLDGVTLLTKGYTVEERQKRGGLWRKEVSNPTTFSNVEDMQSANGDKSLLCTNGFRGRWLKTSLDFVFALSFSYESLKLYLLHRWGGLWHPSLLGGVMGTMLCLFGAMASGMYAGQGPSLRRITTSPNVLIQS